VNGGFAEYVLADPAYVGHAPNGLDFAPAAPVLCAGVTVYKELKETEVRPGEWVAVSGIGGLGHMAVQYAKAMGMHCVAIDNRQSALDLAADLGADLSINTSHIDPVEAIQKAVGGVHGVLVTAVSPEAINTAFDALRRKGTMAIVGLRPAVSPCRSSTRCSSGSLSEAPSWERGRTSSRRTSSQRRARSEPATRLPHSRRSTPYLRA
jgi:propanol-preferring alcohol dehydrogenase